MTQFARELGISVKLLYSWRSQYKLKGTESFPGNDNTAVSEDAKAFAQLKKERHCYQIGIIDRKRGLSERVRL